MSSFVEQLRLAEKAAEDIYFAKLNRELIEALRNLTRTEERSCRPAAPAAVTSSQVPVRAE